MKVIIFVLLVFACLASSSYAFTLGDGKYKFYNDLDFMLHVPDENAVMIPKSTPWKYRIDYIGKWTAYDRVFIKPIFTWDLNESFDTATWSLKTTVGVYVKDTWSVRYQIQTQNHRDKIYHAGVGVEF